MDPAPTTQVVSRSLTASGGSASLFRGCFLRDQRKATPTLLSFGRGGSYRGSMCPAQRAMELSSPDSQVLTGTTIVTSGEFGVLIICAFDKIFFMVKSYNSNVSDGCV